MDQKVVKTLLILKHSADSLTAIETFLSHRDWIVHSTAEVRVALEMVVNHKPQFVMIPTDHHNAQVMNLPKILTKTLPICILYYIEVLSVRNVKILQDVESEYILSPPVTGPGIERMASKYFKRFHIEMREFEKRKALYDSEREKFEENLKKNPVTPPREKKSDFGENSDLVAVTGQIKAPDDAFIDLTSKSSGPRKTLPQTVERTKADAIALVEKGTQEALERVVRKIGDSPYETLSGTSEVACIALDSPRISGYLIAALGQNRKIDQGFMTAIKSSLSKFLIDQGELPLDHENLSVTIKKVEFESWAAEYGEFLLKTQHEGVEIAMAFFSRDQVKAEMEIEGNEEMLAINLDEIQVDSEIDFNAYIYLPANKKYVLYTPRGSKMYDNQKARLYKVGVTQLFVFKAEAYYIEIYRARHYLNSLVDSFDKQPETKKVS